MLQYFEAELEFAELLIKLSIDFLSRIREIKFFRQQA